MDVRITTPRFAVEYRPRGERKWVTVATLASSEVAMQAMYDLMDRRSGDWRVSQVPGTCMEVPRVEESG